MCLCESGREGVCLCVPVCPGPYVGGLRKGELRCIQLVARGEVRCIQLVARGEMRCIQLVCADTGVRARVGRGGRGGECGGS